MPSRATPRSTPTRRVLSTALLAATLAAGLLPAVTANATPAGPAAAPAGPAVSSEARELAPGATFDASGLPGGTANRAAAAAGVTPPVGTTRQLLALDDDQGILYLKPYTLQAVGAHIEVWVADDTSFPAGDCRLAVPGTTTVTRAQAEYLAGQFDTVMYPKESAAFSTPTPRDGSASTLGVPTGGDGTKIVSLIDNVRDDNYYRFAQAPTYIAGFFSTQFNQLMDRNVMTIDAYDWLHRTGANPADAATTDPCTSRPARPFLYEGTFAHEYQHLLQSYTDPLETTWINEGLSDYAISLTGYGRADRLITEPRAESHIYCHQGFGTVQTPYNPNPRNCGGPENSLTLWGDKGDADILADYGIAWSFMLYLSDHYGLGFMSTLHRDGAHQGLVGVQRALDGFAPGTDLWTMIHDFQTMDLVDRYVGGSGGTTTGRPRAAVTSAGLNATVNVGNDRSYADPGAPANGADYVALRAANGLYLQGRDLSSVSFSGTRSLTPDPLAWTVVPKAPTRAANPAIWSGNASNTDATAVTRATVPTGSPKLTFSELHLAEATYDYAYTLVSTDDGATYTPLANADTVPGPLGPALNGDATAFATQTFDLTPYAGKSVLIGFRYVSDGGTNDGGWYVDNVRVGATLISDGSSLAPFDSTTEVRPSSVYRFTVRLVGIDAARHTALVRSFSSFVFTVPADIVAALRAYPRVVAIVSYDEPTEQLKPQAPYTLTVNGVVQPGGGGGSAAAAVTPRADRF